MFSALHLTVVAIAAWVTIGMVALGGVRNAARIIRLLFIAGALRRLIADENFTTLLRAEGLDSIPKYVAERIVTAGPTT